MDTAQYWIDHLDMVVHPEGGYYKESLERMMKLIMLI